MSDTIAAIATPNAIGAIAIIRVSGKNTYSIISKLCNKNIERKGNTVEHTFIYDFDKKVVDEVVLVKFVEPKSFTGEDVVEINCHGGIVVSRMILDLLLKLGARLAQPGEFSERAFKNNKINLKQAMAINNLISAKNEKSAQLAASGLIKKNINILENIKNSLFNVIGQIETNIDYPEYDDIQEVTSENLLFVLNETKDKLIEIIEDNKKIKYIQEGIKVAIIGKPNVGKSSLINSLVGHKRVIVSNTPGTTRDTITVDVMIDGLSFIFSDTAGIRKTKNSIESLGIKKAKEEIKKADFVVFLIDDSKKIDDQEKQILKYLKNKDYIIVKNKSDLSKKSNQEIEGISISSKSNDIKPLIDYIYNHFSFDLNRLENTEVFKSNKEIDEIKSIISLLQEVIVEANKVDSLDLIITDVEKIYIKLCELTGEGKDIDLIDKMFRNFCIGK